MRYITAYISLVFIIIFPTFLQAQCADNGNVWINSWESCTPTTSPNTLRGQSIWLQYEFTQAESINQIHIWNANRQGESLLGANNVIIDYSINGSDWVQLASFNLPRASENSNYEAFEGPSLNGIFVQKILFTFLDNHQPNDSDCIIISEIQLDIDEEACYGLRDACGCLLYTSPSPRDRG